MIVVKLDNVEFRLKEYQDFSWIKKYGTIFKVIDQTGSGCICFGLMNKNKKYFIKIAGAKTTEAEITPDESIKILKNAAEIYKKLNHQNLVKLIEHYPFENYYVAVFEWVDGECLFDHWNFEYYSKNPNLKKPSSRFKDLPNYKKLKTVDTIFSFFETVAMNNYVAVDFYDGSIMYNFDTDTTTICDIDFYRKKPAVNDMGECFFGTKRLKAPEEYVYGACIDEITNIYTLGALIFHFFGQFSENDIKERYLRNSFFPCSIDNWNLDKHVFKVALKAVNLERDNRFKTITQFHLAWNQALKNHF